MAKMFYSICPKESAMSLWMSFLFECPSKTFFMSSGLPTYLHAGLPSGIEIYGNKNRMDRFYIFIKKSRGEKQEGGLPIFLFLFNIFIFVLFCCARSIIISQQSIYMNIGPFRFHYSKTFSFSNHETKLKFMFLNFAKTFYEILFKAHSRYTLTSDLQL